MKLVYQANDGKIFNEAVECRAYEHKNCGYFLLNNNGDFCDIDDDNLTAIIILNERGVHHFHEDLNMSDSCLSFDFEYPGVFIYNDYMQDFVPYDKTTDKCVKAIEQIAIMDNIEVPL